MEPSLLNAQAATGENQPVSMSAALDAALQKIYTEFFVLSDISKSKMVTERKQLLSGFAWKSHQYALRVFAAWKWSRSQAKPSSRHQSSSQDAGESSKEFTDKCFEAESTCREVDELYHATADELCRCSREVLAISRVPYFQVPMAIAMLGGDGTTDSVIAPYQKAMRERIVGAGK